MITFALRWFKGLILGWIMSLVFMLVQRMLKRAFGAATAQHPDTMGNTPSPHPAPNDNVVETIWAGMPAPQLRRTFGEPRTVNMTQNGEVWTYANLNGQGTRTAITIERGIITTWQDIRDPLPSS